MTSEAVNQVDQCCWRAAAALGVESKVHWSTALAKSPLQRVGSIHFSTISQFPMFTPRRKGTDESPDEDGVAAAAAVVTLVGVTAGAA